jgi:hypothetical protein
MDRIIHDNLSEGPCSNLSQEDKKFVKLHLINDFLTETLKDYELAQNLSKFLIKLPSWFTYYFI